MPRSSSATSARRAAGTSCHLARLCHHRQSNCCHRPCKAARTHRRRYRRERREKHLCRYRCQTQPRRSDSIPQHLHGSRWAAHSASRRRMGRSAAETPATAVWGLMALKSAASLQDCRRRRWHQTEQAEVSPALQDCRRRRWHQALERAACSVQGCRTAPISTLAALRLGVAQTRSVGMARWVRSLHRRSRPSTQAVAQAAARAAALWLHIVTPPLGAAAAMGAVQRKCSRRERWDAHSASCPQPWGHCPRQ